MTLYKWSQTAAADATADTSINWQEGQAPSSVNDSARAMMAAMAKYRDDTAGRTAAGGSSTAYTFTSSQGFSAAPDLNGVELTFVCGATNAANVTLNVDGLGAFPIVTTVGAPVPAGSLVSQGVYSVTFYSSTGAFHLRSFYVNPFNIPIGGGMDYWGTTVPNSNFAFPIGQAISRTTYAALFAILGTTYGSGDGTTTFNLPDKRGRVSAALDPNATVLTSFVMSPDGTALGAKGGAQASTLVTANLPAYTPAGTITNGAITTTVTTPNAFIPVNSGNIIANSSPGGVIGTSGLTLSSSQATSTFAGTAQGGTASAFPNVQPTILCNYIIRIT